jgi:hypothetical protein
MSRKGADPGLVTRPHVCRLLVLTARRFARLEASGVFAPVVPGSGQRPARYDAAAVVAAWVAHREAQLAADRIESAQDRRDRTMAEKNELWLARELGQLWPRGDVISDGRAYISAVQAKLRALVPRAVQEGMIPPEAAAALTALIEEAIDEMSRWRTSLDLADAEDDDA